VAFLCASEWLEIKYHARCLMALKCIHEHRARYRLQTPFFASANGAGFVALAYVPGDWIADADFATLERINASYVSETLKQRHDDVVWRVKLKDRWLWAYLVLEFQSEPDPWMALRMLVYLGLLAQLYNLDQKPAAAQDNGSERRRDQRH
jgi:hypothetical protein